MHHAPPVPFLILLFELPLEAYRNLCTMVQSQYKNPDSYNTENPGFTYFTWDIIHQ